MVQDGRHLVPEMLVKFVWLRDARGQLSCTEGEINNPHQALRPLGIFTRPAAVPKNGCTHQLSQSAVRIEKLIFLNRQEAKSAKERKERKMPLLEPAFF
jgi:hypothetical protein